MSPSGLCLCCLLVFSLCVSVSLLFLQGHQLYWIRAHPNDRTSACLGGHNSTPITWWNGKSCEFVAEDLISSILSPLNFQSLNKFFWVWTLSVSRMEKGKVTQQACWRTEQDTSCKATIIKTVPITHFITKIRLNYVVITSCIRGLQPRFIPHSCTWTLRIHSAPFPLHFETQAEKVTSTWDVLLMWLRERGNMAEWHGNA